MWDMCTSTSLSSWYWDDSLSWWYLFSHVSLSWMSFKFQQLNETCGYLSQSSRVNTTSSMGRRNLTKSGRYGYIQLNETCVNSYQQLNESSQYHELNEVDVHMSHMSRWVRAIEMTSNSMRHVWPVITYSLSHLNITNSMSWMYTCLICLIEFVQLKWHAGQWDMCDRSALEWKNRIPNATNLSIVHFLVLPDSQLTITEITEYTYFSLLWSSCRLLYKIE